METYCNKIISVLNNQQGYLQVFTKACEIIEQQLKEQGTSIDNRDTMTTVSFVDNFKKRLAQEFKR
ncbi:hypothetical protein NIES2101_27685 [Calothrix sp. HK-06]|nr:hypothetical protein NIES2101_27685 [Calothrix sp. HK-06]